MASFADFAQHMDWWGLVTLLISAVAALLCITLHELSHGFIAWRLGDPTAKQAGRLTLNPIKHLDPVGLAMMIIAKVGWAKPVPVDPRYYKNPRRDMVITAMAGPLANLIMGFLFLILAQVSLGFWVRGYYNGANVDTLYYMVLILQTIASISVSLAVFNLLPVPPLDGSRLLEYLLPRRWLMTYYRYARAINTIFLFVLLFTDVFTNIIYYFTGYILDGMYAITAFIPELIV